VAVAAAVFLVNRKLQSGAARKTSIGSVHSKTGAFCPIFQHGTSEAVQPPLSVMPSIVFVMLKPGASRLASARWNFTLFVTVGSCVAYASQANSRKRKPPFATRPGRHTAGWDQPSPPGGSR